jgi:protein toll
MKYVYSNEKVCNSLEMSYRFVLCCVLFQTIVVSQELSAAIDQHPESFWKCSRSENPECQCFPKTNGDFNLQCSVGEGSISADYKALKDNGDSSFEIQCSCDETNLLTESVYKYVKGIPTSNISFLKFNFCPLPKDSLSTFLGRHMNLSFIQRIALRSCSPIQTLHHDSFRNMPQLEILNLQNNQLENFPDDLFDDQLNLKTLWLDSNKLQKISGKIFKNIPQLISLQLGSNVIKQLEIGAFSNLPNLFQLNLQNNQLDILPSDVLQSLENLKYLDLSNNKLTSLDKDAFQFNTQLIELFLRNNSLEVLPEGVFRNNKMLEKISLQLNTKLSTVHRGVFENLESLIVLDLSYCSFDQSSFNKHAFSNLTKLAKLNLSRNKLNGLHSDWFIGLTNLTDLDLSWNSISSIEDNMFSNLGLLSALKLNGNTLVRIEANVFRGIRALKSLYLEDNQIEVIQPAAMEYLKELTTINLARNRLKFDEGLVSPLDGWKQSPLQYNLKLELIDLSENQIAELYSDWGLMKSLTRLILSHNQITRFFITDIAILSPTRDFTLDLRNNQIAQVDFQYAKLVDGRSDDGKTEDPIAKKIVFLDDNPLLCDCDAYFMAQYMNRSMPAVRHSWKIIAPKLTCEQPASLSGIAPTEVNPSQFLCNCPATPGNKWPCDCNLRPVDRTVLFNCQHKNLKEIPTNLPKLTGALSDYKIQMNLSSNSISIGQVNPNSFNCCTDVTTLDLSKNGMESSVFDTLNWAPNLLLRFPSLNRLDLTYNNFNSIPNGVIDAWNGTHNLTYSLSGNPWRCDCTNLALLKFIYGSWKRVEDFNQMRCDNGLFISELSVEKLCPSLNAASKYLTIAMPVLAFLVFCICTIFYRSRRVIRAWLYNRQFCLWCVVQEEEEENDDRIYDAFISFSHNDEKFVDELVAQLERPPVGLPNYQLCLHHRDW